MKTTYEHFGVMVDASRNAVMKVEQLKHLIDCLAKMGYNTLELYTEDTFEVDGEPYFGYMRGRYTSAELKEIDAYAKDRGIEVIPCIQTLAHFTNLVRHRVYDEIVDTDDILLIDEPKTYVFIEKLFATLAENFTSRNVNIGMDEAHRVGLGKYLNKHGFTDRSKLLVRHLEKVAEIAKKYGFSTHMWSDMFFRLASGGAYDVSDKEIPEEIRKMLPENVELTYWDYYHQQKAHYDKMIKAHYAFGKNIWFAGGAWSWLGFAPLTEFSLRTMKPAMESVVEHGVKNVIMTMWGDNGAECSYFSLLPSLYAIRQFADGNFDMQKIQRDFDALFGLKFADFMLLDLPNKLHVGDTLEWQNNPAKALLYADPFMGIFDIAVKNQMPLDYGKYVEILKKAQNGAGRYAYIFDCLAKLCAVLDKKAELGVKTRAAYRAGDKAALQGCADDCREAVKRLDVFHDAFYLLWNKENKPFGWEVQDMRLGGLKQRLQTCAKRLDGYIKGDTDKIDELEQDILPYGDGQQIVHNQHTQLVSWGTVCGV